MGNRINYKISNFIIDEMKSLGWDIELDEFKAETPIFGALPFTNIVAHNAANKTRRLVIGCHYDSKYFPNFKFVGAVDSAVPCAMMIHLAKVLSPHIKTAGIGLTLVFFDGEEAFLHWSKDDSIYGARSLAAKWEREAFPTSTLSTTTLHRMDMLVLLDLIGTKNQKFYSFFRETDKWHGLLSKIEKKLNKLNILSNSRSFSFLERSTVGQVEDDHLPFLQRNVPVLHLIPVQFPDVWHTERDNYSCLDFPTIDNINKVLQVFVYAYLQGSRTTGKASISGGGPIIMNITGSFFYNMYRMIYSVF